MHQTALKTLRIACLAMALAALSACGPQIAPYRIHAAQSATMVGFSIDADSEFHTPSIGQSVVDVDGYGSNEESLMQTSVDGFALDRVFSTADAQARYARSLLVYEEMQKVISKICGWQWKNLDDLRKNPAYASLTGPKANENAFEKIRAWQQDTSHSFYTLPGILSADASENLEITAQSSLYDSLETDVLVKLKVRLLPDSIQYQRAGHLLRFRAELYLEAYDKMGHEPIWKQRAIGAAIPVALDRPDAIKKDLLTQDVTQAWVAAIQSAGATLVEEYKEAAAP